MKLKNLTVASMLALGLPAMAQNTVQTVKQVTDGVELNEAVDLVITDKTPFATTGSVNIKNPDAAVVFENIRPSDVIANHLSKITVNGVELKNNSNCRVSIYRHGSIVLPHSDKSNPDGTAFYPVTFFADDECTDTIASYNNVARNTAGPWKNNARSFTLKRGYMCTVANDANGMGYSHCYIANHKDLKVKLRAELAGKLGFFRIFRWQWPAKKGTCDVGPEDFNASWHYNWGAGTSSNTNYEYVQQRHHEAGESNGQGWKGAWESWTTINAGNETVTHVLGQNEPDNTSGAGEVYTYVTKVPENHREKCSNYPLVDVAKDFLYSGKRIGTFACCNPSTGWVGEYVDWCRQNNIRIDFVATHYYIGGQSPQGCIDRLWSLYNRTGLPVWATEWNNGANWTTEGGFSTDAGWYNWGSGNDSKKNGEWLTDVLRRADDPKNAWLERLACYNAVEAKREIKTGGNITEGGKMYRDYNSTFAYDDANEYFMPWNYKEPRDLTISYDERKKIATLEWIHENSKQSDSIEVQIKQDGSLKWETVKTLYFLEIGTQKATIAMDEYSGVVNFRITDNDRDNKKRYSNIVLATVAPSKGTDKVQFGNVTIDNTNAQDIIYSETMSEAPCAFIGSITNSNSKLKFGNNITTASNTKITYQILPWKSNTETMSKSEDIPFLALVPGNYKFGAMDCEVGTAKSVRNSDSYWSTPAEVKFNVPFPEGVTPIVLTEIKKPSYTNNTSLGVRIYDVTNTGFKFIVYPEEATGQKIALAQNVSYLAITPGFEWMDEENGISIAAGYGQDQIYGSVVRKQLFLVDQLDAESGNIVTDSLRFVGPAVLTELQTNNYPTQATLRRTNVNETIDNVKYLTGVNVRRVLDATIKDENGKDVSQTTTSDAYKQYRDDLGWVVISSNHEGASKPIVSAISAPNAKSNANNFVINAKVVGGRIYVDGVSTFEVYTATGAKVAYDAVQAPGTYVVKVNGKSAKVLVK